MRLAGVDAAGELRLVIEVDGPNAEARARAMLSAQGFETAISVENGETFETHRVIDGVLAVKPPAPRPVVVTMLQLRLALAGAGLLDAVNAWVATQPTDRRIAWEYATTVARDDPWIDDARVALQLTPAAGDALFASAALLAR